MIKVKKIITIVINIFFIGVTSCFLFLIVLYLMGIRPYVVLSGSMEPVIPVGSLVFVDEKYNFEDVEVDDIVAYSPKEGLSVTHRAIDIRDGLIETKGDSNEMSDGFVVSKDNFKGLSKFWIPVMGYCVSWIQTVRGIVFSIAFMIVLIMIDICLSDGENDKKKVKVFKQD